MKVSGGCRAGIVAVVGVRLVGERVAGRGDDHGAVGGLGRRGDLLRAAVGSVSLASTSIAVASASSATVALSSTATGLSSAQVTVTATVAVEPPLERVGEGVGLGAGLVAVVGVRLVGERVAAAATTTVPWAGWVAEAICFVPPSVGVVGEHVDRGRVGVLGDGRRVVDRDRVVVGAGHGHRDGRGRAAVERVGEGRRARRRAGVAVVGVRLVGERVAGRR